MDTNINLRDNILANKTFVEIENKKISRHHRTITFCKNIRIGIDKNIDIKRIINYVNWYGENILFKKMDIEEKHIFPLLGEDHYLIKRAIKEHRRIRRIFKISENNPMKNLIFIEEELELHIRFEEKNILKEISKKYPAKKLDSINILFESLPLNNSWYDPYWI